MLRSMARWTYRSFLYLLASLAPGFGKPTSPPLQSQASHAKPAHRISPETRSRMAGLTPEQVDDAATTAGEVYRGIGVTVGLLGALVILAALAPVAFEFGKDGILKPLLSWGKLVTMVLIGVLAIGARRLKLKDKWIEMRLLAEELRLAALQQALVDVATMPPDPAAVKRLRHEVLDVLEGPVHGQIRYNRDKASRYQQMEVSLKVLTYLGFSVSMAAAGASLLAYYLHAHWPFLLLLTAFVPAAVAAMHGIAGFLRLSELVTQHQAMLTALLYLREAVPATGELTADELTALKRIAAELLDRLRQGDTAWTGIATHSEVDPA